MTQRVRPGARTVQTGDRVLTPLPRPDVQRPCQSTRTLTGTPTISVVIPGRNEADNPRQILPRGPHWIHEVIVVDGCSSDATREMAQNVWAELRTVEQEGNGKAEALRLRTLRDGMPVSRTMLAEWNRPF